MSIKTILGWLVLLCLSLTPVYMWAQFGEGFGEAYDYSSVTHALGEVFGLVGMTMFALTFVLSTRITWIEDIFGGLDKVYITHGILGGTALIMILAHPIFLVLKFVPTDAILAVTYLLPSTYWTIDFGIIGLLGMVILIFITLFTKMKYHRWKFTHEFLGLMFIFAVLHTAFIRENVSQDSIFDGYPIYVFIVACVGLFSFSYSLIIKNRLFRNAEYTVKSIQGNNSMFEIVLKPEHKPIAYKSGQFVFVRFYNKKITPEAHPYSIASASNANEIVLVIKKLGDHTSSLGQVQVGDKVELEGPYGRFLYQKYIQREQIWIAGGIGITPFLSMAQDLQITDKAYKDITLFHAVKSADEFIGDNYMETLAAETKKFQFVPWITADKGYLTLDAVMKICGEIHNKDFFLCGPPAMKQGLLEALRVKGVSKSRIHEEAFDLL